MARLPAVFTLPLVDGDAGCLGLNQAFEPVGGVYRVEVHDQPLLPVW